MTATQILNALPRSQLIQLCEWNDRNGCYNDKAHTLEFGYKAATSAFRETITGWLAEYPEAERLAELTEWLRRAAISLPEVQT